MNLKIIRPLWTLNVCTIFHVGPRIYSKHLARKKTPLQFSSVSSSFSHDTAVRKLQLTGSRLEHTNTILLLYFHVL